MTKQLSGEYVARRIDGAYADTSIGWSSTDVWIKPEDLQKVASHMYLDPELDFAFLNSITAVDYIEYFELVYHLRSMRLNHSAVLKTRVYGREEPAIETVSHIWRGADLQEREIWDLMGVRFDGHPNMKRVLLWEDFPGHPLRRDYIG